MKLGRSLRRLMGRLRGSFAWVEAPELKRRLERGEAMAIVDVRGPDEFTGPLGHIANARNVPIAELERRLAELGRLEQPIVLVCRTDKRSAAAARSLRAAGFARVHVLRRGMAQWNEMGYAVERGAAEATSQMSAAEHMSSRQPI